jgi:hypothetical protein
MKNFTENIAIISRPNIKTQFLFLAFASASIILPMMLHIQWLTGPIVNALLILTLVFCGIRSALVLALIPSTMALASGLLPALLAPVVPFIMISNVIFILSVDYFIRKNNYILGVALGALFKFIFLLSSVSLISSLLYKNELTDTVIQMMSWPQFYTAIIGGLIAGVFIKKFKNYER